MAIKLSKKKKKDVNLSIEERRDTLKSILLELLTSKKYTVSDLSLCAIELLCACYMRRYEVETGESIDNACPTIDKAYDLLVSTYQDNEIPHLEGICGILSVLNDIIPKLDNEEICDNGK